MDRISGLSDELLIKILLLVPTKVAVSTSVLSKRWEFLWMWLPKLEYGSNSSSASECLSLQCFLNKNLPLHKAAVIRSISLNLHSSHFKPEDIKLWIVIAISHYIRKLEIMYSSYTEKTAILPSNLYTCKSLVFLKLDGEILLDVPRMVFLPSLKTLKLENVRYSNEETLQRLLSNCPILAYLSLCLDKADITRKLTIVVPSLQRLSLFIPCDHDTEGIVIATPLKYLKFKDHNPKDHYCLVEAMPKLIEAYVGVDLPDIKSLIGSITSVKRLALCSEVFTSNNLNIWNLLVRMLEDSPILQVLKLSIMDSHNPFEGLVYWNQPSTVPECMLSSLQTFKWLVYAGEPEERDLAVYILQNAAHLKTAEISYSKISDLKGVSTFF